MKITETEILKKLSLELSQELRNGILPFWIENMIDYENDGFFGQIDSNNCVQKTADKGVILTSRILWAFSAAYGLYKNDKYLQIAQRAYEYLLNHFWDVQYGGVYWKLDYKGNPIDTKKQIYAQGFALYGLSEYYRVSCCQKTLDKSNELFFLIEKYAFDNKNDGYIEVFTRQWEVINEIDLIDKEVVISKTSNTHLHIIEPYTNLYRVSPSLLLKEKIDHLLGIFTCKIIDNESGHVRLSFDESWNSINSDELFGMDIQTTWLLEEAARLTGDEELIDTVYSSISNIAHSVSKRVDSDGGMMYEFKPELEYLNKEKCWWVQAEAVVGFFNMFQVSGKSEYLDIVLNLWGFIKNKLIDQNYGEWHWSILANGQINMNNDKAGFWKCPYHNSRMCIELIGRIEKMLQEQELEKYNMKY